jgi:hypothetical protein
LPLDLLPLTLDNLATVKQYIEESSKK